MKKRLSILLIGSLVALSLAGCSGGSTSENEKSAVPQNSSVESTANGESSQNGESLANSDVSKNSETKGNDTSKTENSAENTDVSENGEPLENAVSEDEEDFGPKEGDIIVDEDGNEYVYHEDSTAVSEDEPMPVTSDGMEEVPKFLDVTYTPIDVKDSNVEVDVIDMTNPQYYLIKTKAELDDFVSKYEKTFSLNDVENGVEFNTLAEKFDEGYFENMSLVVIPVEYDKDTETEVGTITIEGNDYVIEVCTQPAESADKINRLCFVIQTYKSDMEGKTVLIRVVEDNIIEELGEEEI